MTEGVFRHKDIKFYYARVLLHPTPSGAPSRREPHQYPSKYKLKNESFLSLPLEGGGIFAENDGRSFPNIIFNNKIKKRCHCPQMGRKTSSAVPPILTLKKVLLKRRDVTLRASLITQRAFFCKLGSVFHTRTMLPFHQAESSLKTPNRATRSVIAVIFKYKGIILH